jgi:hypothetical protein
MVLSLHRCSRFRHPFSLTHSLPRFQSDLFWLLELSDAKMDFSRSTLRTIYRIYWTIFRTGFRPPSLSSGVYFLFGQSRAFSHERTTYLYPSTLDKSCISRGNIEDTGYISKG